MNISHFNINTIMSYGEKKGEASASHWTEEQKLKVST